MGVRVTNRVRQVTNGFRRNTGAHRWRRIKSRNGNVRWAIDPWKNQYQYQGSKSNRVILFSYGADGKIGGEGIDADIGFKGSLSQN